MKIIVIELDKKQIKSVKETLDLIDIAAKKGAPVGALFGQIGRTDAGRTILKCGYIPEKAADKIKKIIDSAWDNSENDQER